MHVKHSIHLASHTKATLFAKTTVYIINALWRAAPVAVDEITYPAMTLELERQHVLQTRDGVHDAMALSLVIQQLVYDFLTLFLTQSQVLGACKGRVEVKGNLPDIRVLLNKLQYVRQFVVVGFIYHQIERCALQVCQQGAVIEAHDAYPQHINRYLQLLPCCKVGSGHHS